jgi:lysophospholipase L1-like esterase
LDNQKIRADCVGYCVVSGYVTVRRAVCEIRCGHDALGFRNEALPERAQVVTIGDSMTYGVGAPRDGSWPHQLGELLHEPVYNMALGGYGPLQYLYLAKHEAKNLRPRHLIVGFYFGNDLIDAYRLAYHAPYWNSWREAGSVVSDDLDVPQLENAEPIKRFTSLRDWLSRNSVLYSMLRITLLPRLAFLEQDRMALQVSQDQQMTWLDPEDVSVRTIFKPQRMLSVLDNRRPMVIEGLRITKHAFTSLQKEADDQGANLLIALIPTKERVYCRYIKDSGGHLPNSYTSLCDAEERMKEDLIRFFTTKKIAYIDVSGAMEKQTYQHIQIYPKNLDGHPLATGYGVIARTVYDAMQRQ